MPVAGAIAYALSVRGLSSNSPLNCKLESETWDRDDTRLLLELDDGALCGSSQC